MEKPKPNRDEMEAKRQKVDEIGKNDGKYPSSIHELALREGKIRKDLADEGLPNEQYERLVDRASDEALKAVVAEREKSQDDLTGLRNKNAFQAEMPGNISLELREKKEWSLLFIDFDHFKKVNDVYGHEAGDQALKKMATIILESIRSSDSIYRYGGEEFIVFLPNTTSVGAKTVAEKIRTVVKNASIEVTDKNTGQPVILKKTVSIGCAGSDQLVGEIPADATAKDLLKMVVVKADQAAYTSKESGRDRVTLFGETAEIK